MQKTRKKITQYLIENQRATAIEISRVLDMTVANVRHHLSALQKDNFVEILGSLPSDGKGRPTHLYTLSKNKNHSHIVSLTKILLETLTGLSPSNYQKSINSITNSLVGNLKDSKEPKPSQLNSACTRLDELGYQSHWEAHKNGPVIILGQCPYSSIIKNHPELCEIDQRVISRLTNSECVQTEKIDRSPTGSHRCVFQLH